VRVHVRRQAEVFKRLGERFGARWTPAILMLDPDGIEQHRIEGFVPADDLLDQLRLGLAHAAFKRQAWSEAAREFAEVIEGHPNGDAAAEAAYWAGVTRYKASGDASALADTADVFTHRYQDTPWAKKASVWAHH